MEIVRSEAEKGIDLGEPETTERTAFDGLRSRFREEPRMFILLIRV